MFLESPRGDKMTTSTSSSGGSSLSGSGAITPLISYPTTGGAPSHTPTSPSALTAALSGTHLLNSSTGGPSYGSGSPSPLDRSRAPSYPQTPPNSFIDTTCNMAAAMSIRRIAIDTQELLSKLDSELTKESMEEDEASCSPFHSDLSHNPKDFSNDFKDSDFSSNLKQYDLNYNNNGEPELETSSSPTPNDSVRESGTLDRCLNLNISLSTNTTCPSNSPRNTLSPTAHCQNVASPVIVHSRAALPSCKAELLHCNIVAYGLQERMRDNSEDLRRYREGFCAEMPSRGKHRDAMVRDFVRQMPSNLLALPKVKCGTRECTGGSTGTIGSKDQSPISLLTKVGLEKHISDALHSHKSPHLIDINIAPFTEQDVAYREPTLMSEREAAEAAEYKRSLEEGGGERAKRVRLIPSDSLRDMSCIQQVGMPEESWQDDDLLDILQQAGGQEDDDEDDGFSQAMMTEPLREQKRRLESELGVALDWDELENYEAEGEGRRELHRMSSADKSCLEEYEWDDDGLMDGAGGIDRSRLPSYTRPRGDPDGKEEGEVLRVKAMSRWRLVKLGDGEKRVDMKVIEPYKKVISHGGYCSHPATKAPSTIIVFSACFLPDKSRPDYKYVMDNLFLYTVSAMRVLIRCHYTIVYLHGGVSDSLVPSLAWLKKCYSQIEYRLRKNLDSVYLVHPDFWVRAGAKLSKVFTSNKFERKLQFVESLQELTSLLPIDCIYVPHCVRIYDLKLMNERRF